MQYLLLHYGYAFLVFGLIIEGDATLVAAAILAGEHYLDLRWVMALAMAVTVVGNELLFEIGAMGHFKRLLGPNKRDRVQCWLHDSRSGFLTLLFSRFMWGFRLIIPLGAGLTRIRRRKFVFTNLFGGIIWVLLLTYFGVSLQEWFASLHADFVHYESNIAVGLFLAGILVGIGSIPWQLTRRSLKREFRNPLTLIDRSRSAKPPASEATPVSTAWKARKHPSPAAPLPRPRPGLR